MTSASLLEGEKMASSPASFVQVIQDLADLRELAPDWRELRNDACHASSVSSPEAIESWWLNFHPELTRAFGPVSLEILAIRARDRTLIGVIPGYRIRRRVLSLTPSQLISVGVWPEGVYETMFEEPVNLVREGYSSLVASVLGQHLKAEFSRGHLDLLRILWADQGLDKLVFEAEIGRQLSDHALISIRPNNAIVYIRFADTWTEHRQVISKSMRDNLAYYPKLFKRNHHEYEIRSTKVATEIPQYIQRLSDLHRSRSVNEGLRLHKIHIEGKIQEGYLENLFCQLAERGEGFISELVVDGKAIASQAFLVQGDTLTIYYSGFDPKWSKFSPLFVLNAAIFEDRFSKGLRNVNFLTIPGQWQLRWGPSHEVETFTSLVVSQSAFSKISAAIVFAKRMIRINTQERLQHLRAQRHDRKRAKVKQDLHQKGSDNPGA